MSRSGANVRGSLNFLKTLNYFRKKFHENRANILAKKIHVISRNFAYSRLMEKASFV